MTTEAEARALRARIYGDVSDASWAKLATVWTRPENLRWLRAHQTPPFCPDGMHWKTWNGHEDAPKGGLNESRLV
jgi:hypothetical protein